MIISWDRPGHVYKTLPSNCLELDHWLCLYVYVDQAGQTRFLLQYMYTMSSDYVDFGHNLRRSLMTNLCSTENRVSLDVVKTYCSPYVRVYLLRLQRVGLKVKDCGEARSLY